jgi:hypothetical protein
VLSIYSDDFKVALFFPETIRALMGKLTGYVRAVESEIVDYISELARQAEERKLARCRNGLIVELECEAFAISAWGRLRLVHLATVLSKCGRRGEVERSTECCVLCTEEAVKSSIEAVVV